MKTEIKKQIKKALDINAKNLPDEKHTLTVAFDTMFDIVQIVVGVQLSQNCNAWNEVAEHCSDAIIAARKYKQKLETEKICAFLEEAIYDRLENPSDNEHQLDNAKQMLAEAVDLFRM